MFLYTVNPYKYIWTKLCKISNIILMMTVESLGRLPLVTRKRYRLKPSGNKMYNITPELTVTNYCPFCSQRIYRFHVILKVNSDYFLKQL
jgi:ribosomal protein L24E